MLCISAAIAVMRCLSVRPSVTFVDHIKTNKHIFKIFSAFGSHTTLVFPYQTGLRYSDGNPPNGGVECRLCYRQKSRFWSNSWLSKIAGRAKCQKHLPTTKPSIWHSRPHTTGYRSIAGRANYEVTKTVTDDHAQMIAQSATHQQMFVMACSMDEYLAVLDICVLVLRAYLPRNADCSRLISWSFPYQFVPNSPAVF